MIMLVLFWPAVAPILGADSGTGGTFGGDTGTGGTLGNCPGGSKLCNPIAAQSITQLINSILRVLIQIGLPVAAVFIIYAGFLYVTARGNEEQIKKAHKAFLWAAVGAAILVGAGAISRVITNTIQNL